MRVSCRFLLAGLLVCSGNDVLPMEQALAALENGGAGGNPAGYNPPGYNPMPTPSSVTPPEPPPPAPISPSTPPAPTLLPPPPAPTLLPPPVAPTLPPPPTEPKMLPPPTEPKMLPPPVAPILPPVSNEPKMLPPPPVAPKSMPAAMPASIVKPQPKQDDQNATAKATLQITDVESVGLDTINIDSGGNWLEKRIWFKKAEILFDEIRKTVEQAADIRMDFVDAVNTVGKKIDNFYDVVSFDKGQLDELLKNTAHKISDASVKREGDVSSKERSLEMSIQAEQKQIEQIGNDIKKIEEFDAQIDKTMGQAFKTIDACRALESKAWDNFKAIGAELDDKKARVLYYEMENAHKNIMQHIQYLKGTLLPYLQNKLVSSVDGVMTTILNGVKALDAKEIHLSSLLNAEEQKDLAVEQERNEAKEKDVEDAWEKEQQAKEMQKDEPETMKKQKNQETSWYMKLVSSEFFDSISNAVISAWEYIVSFFSALPCYFKCIICSIRSWVCQLFGK